MKERLQSIVTPSIFGALAKAVSMCAATLTFLQAHLGRKRFTFMMILLITKARSCLDGMPHRGINIGGNEYGVW
jgi:hypothetical protein